MPKNSHVARIVSEIFSGQDVNDELHDGAIIACALCNSKQISDKT